MCTYFLVTHSLVKSFPLIGTNKSYSYKELRPILPQQILLMLALSHFIMTFGGVNYNRSKLSSSFISSLPIGKFSSRTDLPLCHFCSIRLLRLCLDLLYSTFLLLVALAVFVLYPQLLCHLFHKSQC